MAELPTGTVTFLFSDIEGSTRLLTELAETYEELLTEHRGLVEACVDEAGGHVVDTAMRSSSPSAAPRTRFGPPLPARSA